MTITQDDLAMAGRFFFCEPSEEELNEGARRRFERFGQFNIDRWPSEVAETSMPTIFVEIDDPESFLSLYDHHEGWQRLAEEYAARIDERIRWTPHFIRLNSRSPKDASYPEAPITLSGKQAVSWILSSERCLDDIVTMARAKAPVFICLREWRHIRPAWEFRCFAKDGRVLGVSRYDYHNQPTEEWSGDMLMATACDFYARHLQSHYETVVFDLAFGVQDGDPLLVEINPYGSSDPCCFGSYEAIETTGGYAARHTHAATDDET